MKTQNPNIFLVIFSINKKDLLYEIFYKFYNKVIYHLKSDFNGQEYTNDKKTWQDNLSLQFKQRKW